MIDIEMYQWVVHCKLLYPFHSHDIANGLVFTFELGVLNTFLLNEYQIFVRVSDDDGITLVGVNGLCKVSL